MRYSIRITSSLTGATLAFLSLGAGAALADNSPTPPTPSPLPWSIANQSDKQVTSTPKPWAVTTPTDNSAISDAVSAAAQAVGKAAVQAANDSAKRTKSVHTRTVAPRRTAAQSRRELKASQPHRGPAVRRLTPRTAPLRAGSTVRIRGRAHVVRPGETLSGIFPGSWKRVAKMNGITNPNLIFPGQRINY